MNTGVEFAECALQTKWNKYTYDDMDCQGFVEAVLKDLGIKKPNGMYYNWRGSNAMYRNFYSWRGTVSECYDKYGKIPLGAFVYMWDATGEEERGYTDKLGNFKHVGIYCGDDVVRDSTRSTSLKRDGVGTRTMKGFSHVSLFDGLDYFSEHSYNKNGLEFVSAQIAEMRTILNKMEVGINELFRG